MCFSPFYFLFHHLTYINIITFYFIKIKKLRFCWSKPNFSQDSGGGGVVFGHTGSGEPGDPWRGLGNFPERFLFQKTVIAPQNE
jgi:hypothetical protein